MLKLIGWTLTAALVLSLSPMVPSALAKDKANNKVKQPQKAACKKPFKFPTVTLRPPVTVTGGDISLGGPSGPPSITQVVVTPQWPVVVTWPK